MDKELIGNIQSSKESNEYIHEALDHDAIDIEDAYDKSIEEYKKLQNSLNTFITQLSGIKNI